MPEQIDFPFVNQKIKAPYPVEPILREAEIEDKYRFTMKRAWGAGPCIHWHMLNPSKADKKIDDPTTKRIIGFSFRWGYGSCVVTNFYPVITPSPNVLKKWIAAALTGDNDAWEAWERNLEIIHAIKTDTHMAAWGNHVDESDIERFINETDIKNWHCLGITKSGAPIHPLARGKLYVPDLTKPVEWTCPTL